MTILEPQAPTVSIIIPVYQSEPILPELVRRINQALNNENLQYEIILVNDGSSDGSWTAIEKVASNTRHVRAIDLMRNFGQHNALLCGIRAARFDVIVTMDDDLQHSPEEIINLIRKLNEGYDVVYGTPQKEQHGFLRSLASRVTKMALQKTMGAATAQKVSSFRAFRAPLREAFVNYQSPVVSIDVLLTWGATRFAAIPIPHKPRHAGASTYTFRKLVLHALNLITGFSTWPLQLASVMGFVMTLFGFVILGFVFVRYLIQGDVVPGFPFLASVLAIFSGAQLFALGIIGEYLARIYARMLERPAYVIRESIHAKEREQVNKASTV
ncbi:MAG TPA: glycosyltransferase family 2 protein [Pyrinomonadaceae bacterium]|jgi:Glycosyltransferases involved in cell wall biogenesis|nr:glycosyltransferase family 2 protein [Pyrinomonadaceae bacterium]